MRTIDAEAIGNLFLTTKYIGIQRKPDWNMIPIIIQEISHIITFAEKQNIQFKLKIDQFILKYF